MAETLLTARGVTKTFLTESDPLRVLSGVSLSLRSGETVALTGESGSGKSTLLHLLAGLDTADSGEVQILGTPLPGLSEAARSVLRRSKLGLVFQQFSLVPSLPVAANISLQARLAERHSPARDAHLTAALGLDDLSGRYPEELSGGQQQRVAIARALAAAPDVILADEPTGNLDEATADRVVDLMCKLVAESGAALLMVTHSERLAARLSRRLHLRRGHLS